MIVLCIRAFAVALSLAVPAAAQESAAPVEDEVAFDAALAARSLEYGLAEIAYGRLAAERAEAEPIRAFARRMIDDHARFNEALAAASGAAADLRREDRVILERLQTLRGPAFEQVYIRDRGQERMRHYNLVRKLAAQAQDSELRRIAAAMAPALARQLEEAQALRERFRPIDQGPLGAVPGQSEAPADRAPQAPSRSNPPQHAPQP